MCLCYHFCTFLADCEQCLVAFQKQLLLKQNMIWRTKTNKHDKSERFYCVVPHGAAQDNKDRLRNLKYHTMHKWLYLNPFWHLMSLLLLFCTHIYLVIDWQNVIVNWLITPTLSSLNDETNLIHLYEILK